MNVFVTGGTGYLGAPLIRALIDRRHSVAAQATRAEAEAALRETGMPATILRPWYVLGPGHRWPYLIVPVYWLLEWLPPTRDAARRLALVTHAQMIGALLWSVENPLDGFRIFDAAQIKLLAALKGCATDVDGTYS